jgi:uncharacterized protein
MAGMAHSEWLLKSILFAMSLELLKSLQLKAFPLPRGGNLYFSPERLGLLEGDEALGVLLTEIARSDSIEEAIEKASLKFPEDHVRSLLMTIEELMAKGTIGPLGEMERGRMTHEPLPPLIRLVIANTGACNLACRYCYNKFPRSGDSAAGAQALTKEQLTRALAILESRSGAERELELLFIGGEPFMRFDLMRHAAEQARELRERTGKRVRLFVITNGTLLSRELFDYCTEHNIHIKLSIDGDKTIHDRNRRFPNGKGSYETIFGILPDYFATYGHPCKAVTATVDSFSDDLLPILEHCVALGFNQVELTELYGCGEPGIRPVGEKKQGINPTAAERTRCARNFGALSKFLFLMIRSRRFLHLVPLQEPLMLLHRHRRKPFPCRTGVNSVALYGDGNFYPCHHFYGARTFAMGNLDEGLNKRAFSSFRRHIIDRESCAGCWAHFLCGGECYHRAMIEGSDLYSGFKRGCERRRAIFTEAVYLYHRLREEDPEGLEWYLSMNLYP